MTNSTSASRRRHSIGTFLENEAFNNTASGRQQTGDSRNLVETEPATAPILIDDIDGIPSNENRQASWNRMKRRRHKNVSNKGKSVNQYEKSVNLLSLLTKCLLLIMLIVMLMLMLMLMLMFDEIRILHRTLKHKLLGIAYKSNRNKIP